MRIGFYSPLPPTKSGIADYSAALLSALRKLAEVQVYSRPEEIAAQRPSEIALYQIGNNEHHAFVYEQALRQPGVAVLHEANLHHLIADLTIKRGDWDAYLAAVHYEGDARAMAHALRARSLTVGPDYEGVPLIRRLCEHSRGIVVHSRHVRQSVRAAGFQGPLAVIPHGAWIPETDRFAFRTKLGIHEVDRPLLGIFGFLKPYKRIAECLRAFRRLLQVCPEARLILVGEPHPALPLASLIDSLGIAANVRILGFTPAEDFTGYIAACDIVLNLRYPTVGESSGTMLRSLGLGKPVLVSAVGSFAEYPDDVCLKVPVGAGEEDSIFELVSLLVSRPDLRIAIGQRARAWVERECNWDLVARRYLSFLECVASGKSCNLEDRLPDEPAKETSESPAPLQEPQPDATGPATPDAEYLRGWAEPESRARSYLDQHLDRLVKTLKITPRGLADDRILEMGSYLQITPALRTRLGYGEVYACDYGLAGSQEQRNILSLEGEIFACKIDLFDAEADPFPYPDGYFATVLCCELLEHLTSDPMHMMSELNRVIRTGGHLVLTTPNIASLRSLGALLQGFHPGFFPAYARPAAGRADPRHSREYAPREIPSLFENAGFSVTLLETGAFRDEAKPEHLWVERLLVHLKLLTELRGDGLYAVGKKTAPVQDRFPSWLYY